MKRLLTGLLLLMLSVGVETTVCAQNEAVMTDAELMTQRYSDSYDSLLNSYYLHRYSQRHAHYTVPFDVEDFDRLPDSVIAARLAALHMVVPMVYNDVVRAHIRFYLRVMAKRLELTLMLRERFFPLFETALDRYGVPDEVKYLTIVESALNPAATSRVGAAGLWQFMYNTGKLYGLEVNSVLDERRDPIKSSYAAARYLRDLHGIFNDWTLAIAAYNCGPGNINKAIARSGGKRDFWEIYYNLPRETRGYVPSLIAVVYVMHYYGAHGLHPSMLEAPVRGDTVTVRQDVLLQYVAEQTGMEMDELRTLNPQYRVDYIPGSTGNYALCLPMAKLELFISREDSIYAQTADSLSRRPIKVEPRRSSGNTRSGSGKYYTVKRGDTLFKVATKHGISVSKLKKLNGLKGDSIREGQKLKVK